MDAWSPLLMLLVRRPAGLYQVVKPASALPQDPRTRAQEVVRHFWVFRGRFTYLRGETSVFSTLSTPSANTQVTDADVSPVIRQTLQHWGMELRPDMAKA